jgi:hypothetical protein
MDTEIKLVSLMTENLKTTNEAIAIVNELGAETFELYVKPLYARNRLLSSTAAKVIAAAPPDSQYIINMLALRNLKKAVDFAKVALPKEEEEEEEVFAEESALIMPPDDEAEDDLEDESVVQEDTAQESTTQTKPSKKGKKKKSTSQEGE